MRVLKPIPTPLPCDDAKPPGGMSKGETGRKLSLHIVAHHSYVDSHSEAEGEVRGGVAKTHLCKRKNTSYQRSSEYQSRERGVGGRTLMLKTEEHRLCTATSPARGEGGGETNCVRKAEEHYRSYRYTPTKEGTRAGGKA